MTTMKRVFIIAFLFLIPALAKADDIVEVTMNPLTLYPTYDVFAPKIPLPGGGFTYPLYTETISASFDWNTTTGVLSDGEFSATGGPFFQNMGSIDGVAVPPGSELRSLEFTNPIGDVFQMNAGNHLGLIQHLTSTPGVYRTDLWYSCEGCFEPAEFIVGSATVTAEPIATSEPNTLLLMGVGIAALALTISLQKFRD